MIRIYTEGLTVFIRQDDDIIGLETPSYKAAESLQDALYVLFDRKCGEVVTKQREA
jgi:hypothetical protein